MQSFTNNVFNNAGLIERNTDQDLFRFDIPSLKLFQLSAVPFNVGAGNAGSNLDLRVTLYNSSQTVLNSYYSSTSLSLLIDTSLGAGTYYFQIEGTGNSYAPSYAILGTYYIQGELFDNGILPLRKLELKGTFQQDKHILSWSVQADEPITEQILEVSIDGKNFKQLTKPGNSDRSYTYRAGNSNAALYRVYVEFQNGSHYYSNIVAVRSSDNYKPQLLNNLVTDGRISVTSPGAFDYSLFDLSGKMLSRGKLSDGMNTINANKLINGIYVIRFVSGGEQWSEKLVKQ